MNASKTLAVAVFIASVLVTACSDVPTEPQQQPAFTRSLYYGAEQLEVVAARHARDGASVTRTIGSNGGVISADGVMLVIPAGALDRSVAITMTVPPGRQLGVQLEPHGLTFRRPAHLAFVLNDTEYDVTTASLRLSGAYHADGAAASLVTAREVMPVQMLNGLAAFGVWHFSDYAITKKGFILVGG